MRAPAEAVRAGTPVSLLLLFVGALLGAWFFFYMVGQSLIRIQG
jgi:hypothetical protein